MNRLLKLQKRAARIILQADFMTPSNQMFQESSWVTFFQRIQYHTCVMVFKSLNGQAPEYLTNLLTRSSETHGRCLRSSDKEVLKIPFSRTAYYNKWAPLSEFVSSSIPSWQALTEHAQPFRGARDLAFCLKVPLDSLPVWASSGGSGETARMRRLARTFAACIGDKYQIRLTQPKSFSVTGPHLWNSLPLQLRQAFSLNAF